MEKKYITEKEVSQITCRAVNTLRADRHHGRGIPYYKLGNKVLYRLDTVVSHIEAHRIETTDSIEQNDSPPGPLMVRHKPK
jgi:hypothetical protein